MAGVNKAILIGNLGSDPELRHTPNGTPVANFNIATTEQRSGKNGERNEYTEWHRIVVFGLCGDPHRPKYADFENMLSSSVKNRFLMSTRSRKQDRAAHIQS